MTVVGLEPMKKNNRKQRPNSKVKRKSAGTNKGHRYEVTANGLTPMRSGEANYRGDT